MAFTIKQRTLGAVVVLLLAGTSHATAPLETRRQVTVTGEGEVFAAPDRARLEFGVESMQAELGKAEAEVNQVVRGLLTQLRALGVDDRQISSAGMRIQPEYVWPEPGRERRLSGYRVHRQVVLRLDAVDRLGDFILRATQAGVTEVHPPVLESSRAAALQREALALAARDAQAKAERLAKTLGAQLGAVQTILAHEDLVRPPPMPMMEAARSRMDSGGATMGLSLGELRFAARVTVSFELR